MKIKVKQEAIFDQKTKGKTKREELTQEVNAIVAITEPSSRSREREVNSIVGEIGLGVVPRQIVVVAHISRGVTEDVERRNFGLRLAGREGRSKEEGEEWEEEDEEV